MFNSNDHILEDQQIHRVCGESIIIKRSSQKLNRVDRNNRI